MRTGVSQALRRMVRQSVLWIKIAVLVFAGLAPALMNEKASAAQLTPRTVTISTSEISTADVEHVFSYSMPNTTNTKAGIIYDFCTAPLGTCTTPPGMTVESATHDGQTGWPNNATAFALVGSDTGDCTISTNTYRVCYSRDETVATGVTGGAVTHTISNITSTSSYITVYVRISIYSDNDFQSADLLDSGVVAEAFVRQLTAVGRVAERLKFCVGAMEDDETNSPTGETMPSDCDDNTNFPTTTLVDLGIIDNLSIVASPVNPSIANANTANDSYGILQVNTNASSGIVISYFPETASSVTGGDTDQLRAFRVIPTDCSATTTSTTDQCFISQTDGTGITQGTEEFGMAVACVNDSQGSTDNFKPASGGVIGANYLGDNDFDEAVEGGVNDNCENEAAPSGNTYVWGFDISGTPASLAHTTNATEKVVDDEIIKIRFGATASATTPTGTYTVIITYIATATF